MDGLDFRFFSSPKLSLRVLVDRLLNVTAVCIRIELGFTIAYLSLNYYSRMHTD